MIRTSLEQQAKVIERWKAKSGVIGRDYVPANNGATRTEDKRALLRALAETAAERGVALPFKAK